MAALGDLIGTGERTVPVPVDDHVADNDLADESGAPVHPVPAPDLDRMRESTSYRVWSFERVAGLAPLPAPGPAADEPVERAPTLLGAAPGLTEGNELTGGKEQVRPGAFAAGHAEAVAAPAGGGADPNAMPTAVTAVDQLREPGPRPESEGLDAPWSRPPLDHPPPAAPRP
ncbi:hypothetical protein [Streptomyces sp. NPDC091259]|uniref:hypothetical protein n=1 Tax=Streptomyces sp. NPDC091259 TaxID=3365976 RepID=UPI0037F84496